MNSNPTRDALKRLQKSTKVTLAISRLRAGLHGHAHNHTHIQDVEDLFFQDFGRMNDDQLVDELLNSVSDPLSFPITLSTECH